MSTYEAERLANITANAALLSSLGLSGPSLPPEVLGKNKRKKAKDEDEVGGNGNGTGSDSGGIRGLKRVDLDHDDKVGSSGRGRKGVKLTIEPTRKSRRVAERDSQPNDDGQSPMPIPLVNRGKLPRRIMPSLPPAPSTIYKNNLDPQRNILTLNVDYDYDVDSMDHVGLPTRKTDGSGRWCFQGRWKGIFEPNLSPEEIWRGGAFGGSFFCDTYSNVLRSPLSSTDANELLNIISSSSSSNSNSNLNLTPISLTLLTSPIPQAEKNRFKVKAGQSLDQWEKSGWIWSRDPRGWAQWYLRFWNGRRCVDDERQVKRWLKVAGPTGRFKRALMKKVSQSADSIQPPKNQNGDELKFDPVFETLKNEDVGRVLRQTLWQWGYELNWFEWERAVKQVEEVEDEE